MKVKELREKLLKEDFKLDLNTHMPFIFTDGNGKTHSEAINTQFIKMYLEKRMGVTNLKWEWAIETDRRGDFVINFSANIPVKELGAFQSVISECECTQFSTWGFNSQEKDEEKIRFCFSCHLSYSHHGGGSNGSEICTVWYTLKDHKWQVRPVGEQTIINLT